MPKLPSWGAGHQQHANLFATEHLGHLGIELVIVLGDFVVDGFHANRVNVLADFFNRVAELASRCARRPREE